nr:N-6 DNA methylase [Helicobacter saguini]
MDKLINEYKYPKDRIKLEYPISFGRDTKRADIVIFNKDDKDSIYIVVELKKPNAKDGLEQLKSYAHATGAPLAVWSNGQTCLIYHRKNPNTFINMNHLPRNNQSIKEVLNESFKYIDLLQVDTLSKGNKDYDLKSRILRIEDDVLAGAGVDAFEEVFKLIFIKLYDELNTYRKDERLIEKYETIKKYNDKNELEKLYKQMHNLEFRNYEGTGDKTFKDRIENLFSEAKNKWKGIFESDSTISLTPSHLEVCVSELQECKFFNSNLDIIDDAFEYLMKKESKGEKGQYFTPRYVIDMCVKMLNPKDSETMIDTASGSCGFPIHTCFYVWKNIYKQKGLKASHLFTAEKKISECEDYVRNNVFAIDFDKKVVRIARTLNIIAGDGHTNVFRLNSLNFPKWDSEKDIDKETKIFNKNIDDLIDKSLETNDYSHFNFDILMANPPFAGNIKEHSILKHYDLRNTINFEKIKANEIEKYKTILENPTFDDCLNNPQALVRTNEGYKKIKIKEQPVVTRDVLFIERNLNMLRPGGRMAIVLPQGRFNNSSDKYIREFIAKRARILAVVGLHQNVFKPHTGTKTSVLFLQKWDDNLCPFKENYNIFFATMNEPSKDNSGDKIYVKEKVALLRQTINNKSNEQTLSLKEFNEKYESVEKASFLQYEDSIISLESYKKLDSKEKQKVLKQEAFIIEQPLRDTHGHLIVKHDLFNHDGLTQDGIAEAFIDFAKMENLSFWRE